MASILKNSPEGEAAITPFAGDVSPNVRMAVLLARRRALARGVSVFLGDIDPAIALEAARAVAELPELSKELPKLAEMASKPIASESLARRVVAACEGIGDAKGLVLIASRKDVPENVRVEALNLLGKWQKAVEPTSDYWPLEASHASSGLRSRRGSHFVFAQGPCRRARSCSSRCGSRGWRFGNQGRWPSAPLARG